jgi:transcriptional regulator with XRE-family HTH domain
LVSGPTFASRVRERRDQIGLTRSQLADRSTAIREGVSLSTLREMESDHYRLPKRRLSGGRLPIEIVADVLGVPLGYLLGGFDPAEVDASCFGPQVRGGQIQITHTLTSNSGQPATFAEFLDHLPHEEEKLRALPLHSYVNERAFAVIFRFEELYCGNETLLVNEPPLMFWDDEDVSAWIAAMTLTPDDAAAFRSRFEAYRYHFLSLAATGAKHYKVVLNLPTFQQWLKRKTPPRRKLQLETLSAALDWPDFQLSLLRPDGSAASTLWYVDGDRLEEGEVISKHQIIPDSLEGTLPIQVLQSRPDVTPVEYFVAPILSSRIYLQREKARIDAAFAAGLAQIAADAGDASILGDGPRRAQLRRVLRSLEAT